MPGNLMMVGCTKPQFLVTDLSTGLLEFPYNITAENKQSLRERERTCRDEATMPVCDLVL